MNTKIRLSVSGTNDTLSPVAKKLADELSLPWLPLDKNLPQLVITPHRIEIRITDLGGPIFIDFTAGKNDHRRRFDNSRHDPLAKAIGLHKKRTLTVIDATAGFARDAFVLASLGCKVTLIERSVVMACLIDDALKRAKDHPIVCKIIKQMALIKADATHYLDKLPKKAQPDVIYLDPMYPTRTKSAKVKKDMQLLHRLVGADNDSDKLFTLAKYATLKRVVVKRPKSSPFLDEKVPTASIHSRHTRYDIYSI